MPQYICVMVCKKVNIYGKVHKTGLRYFLKDKASCLNITGRSFYLSDKSLFILAMGKQHEMERFISFCKSGNPYSSIKHIEITDYPIYNYTSFEIIDSLKL